MKETVNCPFFPLDLERDFEDEMRNIREDMKSNKSTENVTHQWQRLEDMEVQSDKRIRLIESTLELTKKDLANLGQNLKNCENAQEENNQKIVSIIEKEVQNVKEIQSQALRNHSLKIVNELGHLKSDLEGQMSDQLEAQIELKKAQEKLGLESKNLEAQIEKKLGTKLMADLHKIETKLDGYLQAEDEKVKALEELIQSQEKQAKLDSKRFTRELESLITQTNQESSLIREVKSDLASYKMQNSQGLQANKEELEKYVEATLESHLSKIKDDMNSKDAQLDLKQTKQLQELVNLKTDMQTLEVKLESNYQDASKSFQQKVLNTESDLQEKLQALETQIKSKIEDKTSVSNKLHTKMKKDLENLSDKMKSLEDQFKSKMTNREHFKEMENNNENLQKSISSQINELKNEVSHKQKSFEAEVKAVQIELENKSENVHKSIASQINSLKSQVSDQLNTVEAKIHSKADVSNLQNIELQVKQVCQECEEKIANVSKNSNETMRNVEHLSSSIKTLQQKVLNTESDHQEKLQTIETQLKSKIEDKTLTSNKLHTKLTQDLENLTNKLKYVEDQIKSKMTNREHFKELENKNENLQNSMSSQIDELKNEVSKKQKSFEAEVKAGQIDIQNMMQSQIGHLSEKIKDFALVKSLKNLEDALNRKNEQCKDSLESKLDGQLNKFSSLEGKVQKLGEDLQKSSQTQDKMDVKLESHRVQLQSLSSLEAKLDSKAKDKYDQMEKKAQVKDKAEIKDLKSQLENLQKSLENESQRFANELRESYDVLKSETIKDCGQLLESSLAETAHKLRVEIQMGHRRELEKSQQLQKEEVMRDIIELQKKLKEADLDRNIGMYDQWFF